MYTQQLNKQSQQAVLQVIQQSQCKQPKSQFIQQVKVSQKCKLQRKGQSLSAYAPEQVIQQNGVAPSVSPSLDPGTYDIQQYKARIKVIGVGGGGGNAVNRMKSCGLKGIQHVAINTDTQALDQSLADTKLQIGSMVTKGLGTGGQPDVAMQAAIDSQEEIRNILDGSDLVFITAGQGGGTGTGAAPVVAEISKNMGILTIGVITFPFKFEGRKRAKQAVEGIVRLRQHVDSLILVPNDRLLDITNKQVALQEAFILADDVLRQGVQGISDIITTPGLVNVDFADIREIISQSGTAMLGVGTSAGNNKAEEAAQMAAAVPLFEKSIERATGIIYNITGGDDMTLQEVSKVSDTIQDIADEHANIIFGAVIDPTYKGKISVTIIATGFSQQYQDAIINKNQGVNFKKRRE